MKKDIGIIEFLSVLDEASINYVSWKNNHELEKSCNGVGDIDLLVEQDQQSKFIALALQSDWVQLQNPVAHFPFVHHFFKVEGYNCVYHLHVYFRVVTGESWLKEYVLPIDKFLLQNRVRAENTRIWILNGRTQRYIFALRHLLKGESLSSRFLYRKELSSYRQEWIACGGEDGWEPNFGPIKLANYVCGANLVGNEVDLPSIWTAMLLRASLWPYLRVSWWRLPMRRLGRFLHSALNKVFWKRKKIFPYYGMVIAISGVDGSGKSTMLSLTSEFLSSFVTVETVQLGRPQGRVLESLRRLFGGDRRRAHKVEPEVLPSRSVTTVKRALAAAVLAWIRLRTARHALQMARRGHLVLADRWPSADLGKMDGPRIISEGLPWHSLVNMFGQFESWAYARMPSADVCIILNVTVESALARNRDRIKEDKESDDEIRMRFEANRTVIPIASKVIQFENDAEFEIMREKLIELIWTQVVNHSR